MDYSDFIKKLGNEISIKSANLMIATPTMATKKHLHPDLLHILYVAKGKGYCIVNNKKYTLSPGTIHVVFPNEPHMYMPEPSDPYTVYFLHINWLGETMGLERIFKVNSKHILPKLFRDITDHCWHIQSPTAELRKASLLCNILAELADMSRLEKVEKQKRRTSASMDKKLASALALLSGPPFIFPGIDTLAKSAGMSRRSFTNFFQKNTEMSARDYFLRNKMIYAGNLMDSKEFKLKEIAFQCGYNNPQNFLRAYKTYFRKQ